MVRLDEDQESIYLDGAVNGNRGIDLSPNNETVAFGGRDGVIYLYTTKGWNFKKKLIGHETGFEQSLLTQPAGISLVEDATILLGNGWLKTVVKVSCITCGELPLL